MSQSLNIGTQRNRVQQPPPQQPPPRPQLPPDQLAWRARALQAMGWRSKAVQQTALRDEVVAQRQQLEAAALRPGGAEALAPLPRGSGREFTDYLAALRGFETADPKTPALAETLRQAAQGYVDHFNAHAKRQREDRKNIAKRDACVDTLAKLRQLALFEQFAGLGDPPWDSDTARRAAGLKASLDIESLPPGEQRAERLDGAGVQQSFWVNKQGPDGSTTKTMIFKPQAPGSFTEDGFIPGTEPAREALAGRIGEMLNGALNLGLQVPETQVISVSRDRLALDRDRQDVLPPGNGPLVGSAQQFAATGGELRDQGPLAAAKVSATTCQSLAILDIISLNCDRHGGNFLVRENGNETELVPIDHGLTFPGPEGLHTIARLGNMHNATMVLPAAHLPFGDEMLAKIEQIDPPAIAEAMRREQAQLALAHPELAGAITEEAIDLAKRSAQFLKLAAPELPPALCQFAIGRHATRLFAPNLTEQDFTDAAEAVIAEVKAQQATITEYFLMVPGQREELKARATALGWDVTYQSADLPSDPAQLLAIVRGNIQCPKPERDPLVRPIDVDHQSLAAKDALLAAFPQTPWSDTEVPVQREALTSWREWQQLGGTQEKLAAIRATINRGPSLREARGNVVLAASFLRQHAALQAQLQQLPPDGFAARFGREVAYLKEITLLLAENQRTVWSRRLDAIERTVPRAVSPAAQETLRQTLKREAVTLDDAVRRQLEEACQRAMAQADSENTRLLIRDRALQAAQAGFFTEAVEKLRRYAPDLDGGV
jgi:hypothetical protein